MVLEEVADAVGTRHTPQPCRPAPWVVEIQLREQDDDDVRRARARARSTHTEADGMAAWCPRGQPWF